MIKEKLAYRDICSEAEYVYRNVWPPARHTRDSRAPPPSFNLAADQATFTRAEVLNLIQATSTTPNSNSKTGNCHKCGKPGHWSKDCPNRSSSQGTGFGTRSSADPNRRPPFNNRGGRGGSQGQRDRNSSAPSWRTTPPPSGAPTTKQYNSRTFHWCAKCKRWTTTHNTSTHTGGTTAPSPVTPAPTNPTANNCSLIQDPSVWSTAIPSSSFDLSDAWFVIATIFKALLPVSAVFLSVFCNALVAPIISLSFSCWCPVSSYFSSHFPRFRLHCFH